MRGNSLFSVDLDAVQTRATSSVSMASRANRILIPCLDDVGSHSWIDASDNVWRVRGESESFK